VPGPGYFAAPFLVDGEKVISARMLRWLEKERRGFLGVELRARRNREAER
jgi:hypothetical protein